MTLEAFGRDIPERAAENYGWPLAIQRGLKSLLADERASRRIGCGEP